jgi:hypothetical protein
LAGRLGRLAEAGIFLISASADIYRKIFFFITLALFIALCVTGYHLSESSEKMSRIVRSRPCFRVVLNGKDRELDMLHSFLSPVVKIFMG